jgi:hypothetical protein
MPFGRADNWLKRKSSSLYRGEQRVRQTAVVYTQKKERNQPACINARVHLCIANPSTVLKGFDRERELKGFDRERNAHKKPLLEILWCDDYQDSLHGVWNSGTA